MKKKRKEGIPLFLALLALYAAVFGARALWSGYIRAVRLEAEQPRYFHDAIVRVRLTSRDPKLQRAWRQSPPFARVVKDGREVTTIGGLQDIPLAYDPATDSWTGRWPCPWNAPAGRYDLDLAGPPEEWHPRVVKGAFEIAYRKPAPLPPGFSALTLESTMPFATMKVPTPSGGRKDWRGLIDWVEYAGADALWILGGRTPGDNPGEIWVTDNLPVIPEMAKECRRRGIKFGVYVMCTLTMSKERLPGYEYAMEVEEGRPVPTRAISLRDKKRFDDIIALLKTFRDIPEVDYLGLDYIRNALGGYELAEEFYAEMPGMKPPSNWGKLSKDERMVYFARKKVMRKDLAFIDAWQWWRAHKVAGIVRRIKGELGDKKPLWAFTLTWDKGWHHGQDAVMMNDAGVDADALMLYEATAEQFDYMVGQWGRYVQRSDVQLIVGDVIDWALHQKDPAGPEEYYRRATAAIDRIYADGPAYGMFAHDLGRAFWGRIGPWGTKGWMEAVRRVVAHMKEASRRSRGAQSGPAVAGKGGQPELKPRGKAAAGAGDGR